MSLQFEIKVGKDHGQVKATWDIQTDGSDTELIANFVLTVEGKKVDTQCGELMEGLCVRRPVGADAEIPARSQTL